MALIPQPPQGTTPYTPPTPEQIEYKAKYDKWSDQAALRIVVGDCLLAENFAATKAWILAWPIATALYQSPYSARY